MSHILSGLIAIAQKYRTMNVEENILSNYNRHEERKKERETRKKNEKREAKRKKQFCLVSVYARVLLTMNR